MKALSVLRHIIYGDLPYAEERRAAWPRVLGWALAFIPWCILIALWLVIGERSMQ